MSNHKHLVYAILSFLNQQKESGTLKEDAVESLEGKPCIGRITVLPNSEGAKNSGGKKTGRSPAQVSTGAAGQVG